MNCWFCDNKEAENGKSIRLYMYGEIQTADAEENKKHISYNSQVIDVPRCSDCKKKHFSAAMQSIFAIAMLIIMLAAGICAVAGWLPGWLWGLILGFAAGILILFITLKSITLKGIIKKSRAKKDFPPVKDLLARGYKFGKSPSYEESVRKDENALQTTVVDQPKNDEQL